MVNTEANRQYKNAAKALTMTVVLVAGTELSIAGNLEEIAEPTVLAPAPATELDLNGFYAGGSLAYAFGQDDEVGHTDPNGRFVANAGTFEPEGLNYGLRLGWRNNLPLPSGGRLFVYGFELGYDFSDIEDSFSTAAYDASTEIESVLSLKYKGGITNSKKNTLFYTTLGYINTEFDYDVNGATGGDTIALNGSDNQGGLVFGLGVERAINQNLSALLEWEYNYINSFTLRDSAGASTVVTPSFNNIRLGLNYSF
ncbi:outer membrane protein [Roseovarius albus]|nr:outer membrane beta-barrel protein [Roseovarius albus]